MQMTEQERIEALEKQVASQCVELDKLRDLVFQLMENAHAHYSDPIVSHTIYPIDFRE